VFCGSLLKYVAFKSSSLHAGHCVKPVQYYNKCRKVISVFHVKVNEVHCDIVVSDRIKINIDMTSCSTIAVIRVIRQMADVSTITIPLNAQ
jgi:hypothetical protein